MNTELRQYIYSLMTDKKNDRLAMVVKFLLLLLSLAYRLSVKISLALRKKGILPTAKIEGRVISIGNISVGGTGKTPLVEYLAHFLSNKGNNVAILTRGYRLPLPREEKILYGIKKEHVFEEIGDEPALLKRNIPQASIMVGSDRIKNGKRAVEKHGADVLLLDDGFQYWRLSRDVDIVLVDTTNPFGNGFCLPRGILREPVSNLIRADIIVLSKADMATNKQIDELKTKIKSINPNALIVTSAHKPYRVRELLSGNEIALGTLKDKEVCAMAGIADPDYFQKTLKDLGAKVKATAYFQDHHPYSYADVELAAKRCIAAGADTIIVTEKDGIKLKPILQKHSMGVESFQLKFLELAVRTVIRENEDKFVERLKLPVNTAQQDKTGI